MSSGEETIFINASRECSAAVSLLVNRSFSAILLRKLRFAGLSIIDISLLIAAQAIEQDHHIFS